MNPYTTENYKYFFYIKQDTNSRDTYINKCYIGSILYTCKKKHRNYAQKSKVEAEDSFSNKNKIDFIFKVEKWSSALT